MAPYIWSSSKPLGYGSARWALKKVSASLAFPRSSLATPPTKNSHVFDVLLRERVRLELVGALEERRVEPVVKRRQCEKQNLRRSRNLNGRLPVRKPALGM